ncbi:hypothetical protein C3B47_14150 [Flavobacterium columnare]|uniref:restriction endonuclease subunit S n=1 Tax=Flavobacterium columnare TaxID=996 RepID=UPI0018967D0F|nr:restriction endonuclease subunit S [Flavobacterium columnare]MBF6653997.1 hypothetical protein [Flavobacterium columnare]MBF6654471.1 hypothetical protein [Flavobacterium columnare]
MNKLQKNIPNHWKWVTLDEVSVTSSGGTPDRKNPNYFKGNIPWVKSGELNYNIITETEEYISQEALDYSSAKMFPKGSLLIALYGNTVGRMAFLGVDAATNQAIASITPFLINPKYLFYYLMSSKEDLLNKREGSAQPNISQKVLNEFPFPLAPIEEQNRIVDKIEELFSELDTILNVFDESLYKLKLYWNSELKSFLKGDKTKRTKSDSVNDILLEIKKIRAEQKIKYKGEIENFKNIEIEIPENWKAVKLSDVFINPSNSISDGPFGSNLKSSDFQKQGYPILKIQNIERNEFISKDISYVDDTKFNELKRHQFSSGDIIITKLGSPLGKACIVPSNFEQGVIVADLIRIKKNEFINSKFLMYSLNAPYMISQIEKLSKGTTRQRVTLNGIRNLTLVFPSLFEQNIIANKIEELDDEIKNLTRFIKRTVLEVNALKQKILADAFSGDLVYNDLLENTENDYLKNIIIEKEKFILLQKEKNKLIPKVKKMKADLDLEEILKSKNEPVKSFDLWQESIYKDNIEEFYKKLKELDTKVKEFKEGHLSYIELIK